jgi:glycerol-3-phosphate dehydrogenase
MRHRSLALQRAASANYQICVIGGGATGAGCALDAQLRGLRTLVLEAGDFGSGTSNASTKLIHGGLRYLQQAITELDAGQYRVVRRALAERELMLANAQHLAQVRRFAVPCFSLIEAAYYAIGLKLYDWLAGKTSLPRSEFLSRSQSVARVPFLAAEGIFGAVEYSDGQFDDARFNLALIQSCADAGGEVLNYARVVDFEKDEEGRLIGALVEDLPSGERFQVAAQRFINATGPFSDGLRRLAFPGAEERLTLSKGVHILLPLPENFGERALLIPKTEDGRVIFAIPWFERLLVGTTETECTLDTEVIAARPEAEYLLRHLNRYTVNRFELSDIVSAIAGLRPLVRTRGSHDTKKMIRDYEIEIESRSGLISVLGGKWTVYRAMAEDAINAAQASLGGRVTECPTRHYALSGFPDPEDAALADLAGTAELPVETLHHLTRKFGRFASRILDLTREDRSLMSPLVEGAPPIRAEVVYCAREEMAVCVEDVLNRRLGLQPFGWRLAIQAAPVVAEILAREMGWSPARRQQETERYVERIQYLQRALGLSSVPAETVHSEER